MKFLMYIKIGYVVCLLLASSGEARQVRTFDFDWRFAQGDCPEASAFAYDDAGWRTLDLPHDWSIGGEYDEANPGGIAMGFLPGGIGWYRKTFEWEPAWKAIWFPSNSMVCIVLRHGIGCGTIQPPGRSARSLPRSRNAYTRFPICAQKSSFPKNRDSMIQAMTTASFALACEMSGCAYWIMATMSATSAGPASTILGSLLVGRPVRQTSAS